MHRNNSTKRVYNTLKNINKNKQNLKFLNTYINLLLAVDIFFMVHLILNLHKCGFSLLKNFNYLFNCCPTNVCLSIYYTYVYEYKFVCMFVVLHRNA